MPEDSPEVRYKEEIAKIKDWMNKQPHLPHTIDDTVLARFLHSCYYSVERTKQCIELFFKMRAQTPEFFNKRDPLAKEIQQQLDITFFASTQCQESKKCFAFWQLNDPNLDKYVFYDCMKAFFMQTDVWMMEDRFFEEEDVVIVDFKGIPMKIITAINISSLRKGFTYLLEALPARMKQVHAINCPPFMDKLFALVKPILSPEICSLIHFHQPNTETLYQYVPRELVPVEFGGTGPSASVIMDEWIARMRHNREFFLENTRWVSDEKKRAKKQYAEEADLMKGSFRSLCVD